jgi:hypothetical protein
MMIKAGSVVVALILVSMIASSCSTANKAAEKTNGETEDAEASLEACPVSGESKEAAIFTYDDAKRSLALDPEIYLTLKSEPINIPDKGFVKFKGAALGSGELALVEIGGVGEVVKKGDMIGRYVVGQINFDHVKLVINDTNGSSY